MPDELALPPAEFRILLALLDGPKHGHGIKLDVRHRTEGQVNLGPGTLYGAIKRLVKRGWIFEVERPADSEDERRRYYQITGDGRQAAAREARRMAELIDIARAKALRIG